MKRWWGSLMLMVVTLLSGGVREVSGQAGEAEPFARGSLDLADRDEYGVVFSPDLSEVFLTIRRNRSGREFLATSVRTGSDWSEPSVLPFSGGGFDKEPFLSPDGSRLFFASTRPLPGGERLGFEIWVSTRTEAGWSDPTHLAALAAPGTENYPAVSGEGHVYFGSDRIDGRGVIFVSRFSSGEYGEPQPVVTADGEPMAGADPYIDPLERFLIHSSTRPGGRGEGDLYLTPRVGDGWGESVSLGSAVNTTDYEYTPFVSQDGRYLYFSRGWGELWRIPVSGVPVLERLVAGPGDSS